MNLTQDVRHGLRLWARSPGFIAVVVLTLALGIGANTAMFSILHEALLKPLPFKDPERLVLVSTTFGGEVNPISSFPDYYDYRDQTSSLESLAATSPAARKVILAGSGRSEFVSWMLVSSNFFDILGVAPITGRWFAAEEGNTGAGYVAVVSEGLARRRFGDPQHAVGQSLALSGIAGKTVPATIVGVMPASFRYLDDAEVWTPMRRGEDDGPATRQFHNWLLVGRLKPGVPLDRAQAEADVIAGGLRQHYPDSNRDMGFLLEPLQRGLLRSQTPSMIILMVAVGLVLLIACANVAGLLLARGTLRAPELAMRTALGASRMRIIAQLLTESFMMALLSGILGIALAFWLQKLLPIATGLAGLGVSPRGLQWRVLLFALGASILTGLLFGFLPALRTSSVHLTETLAHGPRATHSRGGMSARSALVISQVAISLVLLIAAGLLIRSLAELAATNPGFTTQHLLTGEIQLPNSAYPPERRFQFFEQLRSDFTAIPGVTAVGFIDRLPIRHPWGNLPVWPVDHPPADPSQQQTANTRLVFPGYFDALDLPLLAGRDITDSDHKESSRVIVLDQRLAKALFPGKNPLGQHVVAVLGPLASDIVTSEVVGVVGDARLDSLDGAGHMAMYFAYAQLPPRATMRFAVRTSLSPQALAASIRKVVAARDRDLPLGSLVSMDQLISDSLLSQRVTVITLALFAAIAMLLAAIGLYGTLAYWVNQRLHEIGIRMALGARRPQILRLIVGHGMRLTVIGAVIGLVASFALTRLMRTMIYAIGPYDPITFAAVVALLTVIAAGACYLPARRAVHVDPVTTLRAE